MVDYGYLYRKLPQDEPLSIELLKKCDISPGWEQHYRTQDLDVQFWANSLWIKQVGIVAYNFVIYRANMRSIGLGRVIN